MEKQGLSEDEAYQTAPHVRARSPAGRSGSSPRRSRRFSARRYAPAVISKEPFGRTGHDSTRIIFGAAALGCVSQEVADRRWRF